MTEHPAPTREAPVSAALLVLVGAVALAASCAGLWARATYGARLTADEPQYLLSATSLWEDGDLDISNQLEDLAYLPYHEVRVDEQTMPLDESGRRVSPHDPLLPLLLAVPMGLGGWVAAKAVLAVLGAATAALAVWVGVARLGVAPRRAALVVGAAFVGMPLAPYGVQVYPELPAGGLVLACFALVTGAPPRGARTWAAIACVVALPWLSVKYAPVAAVLGVALVLARRRADLPVCGPVVAGVAAAVLYAAGHQLVYGGWTAYATGDHFAETGELAVAGTQISLPGRARRLVGLLVDRDFGIAVWSPLWLALPGGLASLARRRPPGGVLLLAVVGTGWLTATFVALTMHGWWVPGRQVVHVLPLAVIEVAWGLEQLSPRLRRAGERVVAVLGVVALSSWLWLAFEASRGDRTLVVDFASTGAPLRRVVAAVAPDGMRAAAVDDVLLAAWAIALGVTALVAAARTPGRVPTAGSDRGDRRGVEVR